jgi:hypothetical protein
MKPEKTGRLELWRRRIIEQTATGQAIRAYRPSRGGARDGEKQALRKKLV